LKLLIDENIPLKLADKLLKKYKDSIYIPKSELKGKSDRRIYTFAKKKNLTIIPFDTEFLGINTYPLQRSSRIVLRFKHIKIQDLTKSNLKSTEELENKNLNDTLVIIDKNKIRIARLTK